MRLCPLTVPVPTRRSEVILLLRLSCYGLEPHLRGMGSEYFFFDNRRCLAALFSHIVEGSTILPSKLTHTRAMLRYAQHGRWERGEIV